MRITLINQAFHPDVVSSGQHLTDLAVDLEKRGHDVMVVTSRRAYDDSVKTFPKNETWRGIKIYRVFNTGFGKRAKWRRAVDFLTFLISCCGRLALLPKPDVVVALTSPPLVSVIAAAFAKLRGAKFCYWIMDLNPDEAIAAGWLQADSFAARWLERMSRFSLRRADGIIALDRFMRDRIVAKHIAPEKVAVIPPWSQDRQVVFDAAGREAFRAAHGLAGKFVVMYSGNHSPVHPLDTLMQAAEQLRGETDIVFCFIGGGSEFARVKKWAVQNPQVLCLPYQPLDKLSASLSAADAHLVVMGNAMLGLVHPCKIYNIMAVGAPVVYLGPEPSHVTEILGGFQTSHPWVGVRHGAAGELAGQIRQLRRDGAAHVRQPPAEVETQFSQAALLPQLVAVIEAAKGKA